MLINVLIVETNSRLVATLAQAPFTLMGLPFSSNPAEGIRFTNLCPASMSNTSTPWPPYSR